MGLVHDHFQDYLILLKKRKLKLMHTANLDGYSGSISEVSALKALKDCTVLDMQKTRNNRHFKIRKLPGETDDFQNESTLKAESLENAFQKEAGTSMEVISASKLKEILEAENSLLILDVRDENELSGKLGHFENSINIPVGSLRDRISELETMRDREIVTVCRSGVRAATAAEVLAREGFGNVKVLTGGMLAWREIEA